MKLKYSSIKFQIGAAFIILAVPLLMMAYYNIATHSAFITTLNNTSEREIVLAATSNLQRDVIDLQRNVFIYKNSASRGSANKVEQLYTSLNEVIDGLSKRALLIEYDDTGALESISNHLKEYKSNFDIVVSYREQKASIVDQHITSGVSKIEQALQTSSISKEHQTDLITDLHYIHNESLTYLITGTHSHIEKLQQRIFSIREQLSTLVHDPQDLDTLTTLLQEYEKNIQLIVSLSRNYIYLINVVMAGSAQEIIYHTDYLANQAHNSASIELAEATKSMNERRLFVIALSCFGLAIATMVPIYFFGLITKPIERITGVFNKLAAGKQIDEIPGYERSDEIGSLANAAQVFKHKNEQTQSLLVEAERSVEIQQRLNSKLAEANTRTKEALSVKSDFLANMSHELRTPLNSVIGYTVRILKNPENFNEKQTSALSAIERNSRHLLNMINDILDLSKIEANKLDVNFQNVDLYELCQDAIDQLYSGAEDKGLQLLLEKGSIPQSIRTDPVRLMQILINLLSNGIKYTETGWVKLTINADLIQKTVTMEVSDSGQGIKKDDITRLFQRFEQVEQTAPLSIGSGTGLGLAIVDKLAGLLGGKITAESEFGVGSKFTITLPIYDNQPNNDHNE